MNTKKKTRNTKGAVTIFTDNCNCNFIYTMRWLLYTVPSMVVVIKANIIQNVDGFFFAHFLVQLLLVLAMFVWFGLVVLFYGQHLMTNIGKMFVVVGGGVYLPMTIYELKQYCFNRFSFCLLYFSVHLFLKVLGRKGKGHHFAV